MLTDNDSHMYSIQAENSYENFYKNKGLFDFSNYPKDSKYNNANNLVVDKMRDEKLSVFIKGFVGLKSEINTFIKEDNHEAKKSKRINKDFVDDEIKMKISKMLC